MSEIDWRKMFKDVFNRMRDAGESQEMGARWMATAAKEAVGRIEDENRELEKANVAYVDANTGLIRENKELRQKLFPYADSTEISGISWDGKYLIGDKASIKFFHEMKNRGEQLDVYKRAYDERVAAKDAEIAKLRDAMSEALEHLECEPGYHDQGMGCGLEDRNITERYEAMAHGWDQAMERVYGENIAWAKDTLSSALKASEVNNG